jgi:hypothetical protein
MNNVVGSYGWSRRLEPLPRRFASLGCVPAPVLHKPWALPALVLAAAVLTACGSAREDVSACGLLERDVVARQLAAATGDRLRTQRESSESLDQSICRYSGPGVTVGLNVDSAPEVRRRYFNRVTEAIQFSVDDPGQRPQPVPGLGDDDALGPAGAYWVPSYRQLVVLRGARQFVYQFSARGVDARTAQKAARAIAAATLPGERVVRGSREVAGGRPGPLELALAAPRAGEVVRSRSVVVRGTVSGDVAAVRVAGRPARVSAGTFARAVPLSRGPSTLRIVAVGRDGERVARSVTVRRGQSPAAVGAAFARRQPGRMPDVLAARLPDARALLRGAGIPVTVIRLTDARLPEGGLTVCSTQPAPGLALRRGQRALLRADAADQFRTSGTSCARE